MQKMIGELGGINVLLKFVRGFASSSSSSSISLVKPSVQEPTQVFYIYIYCLYYGVYSLSDCWNGFERPLLCRGFSSMFGFNLLYLFYFFVFIFKTGGYSKRVGNRKHARVC